jgi:hypothetical protein
MAILGNFTKKSWTDSTHSIARSQGGDGIDWSNKVYILNELLLLWDNPDNEDFRNAWGDWFVENGYGTYMAHFFVAEITRPTQDKTIYPFIYNVIENCFNELCEFIGVDNEDEYFSIGEMFEVAGSHYADLEVYPDAQ